MVSLQNPTFNPKTCDPPQTFYCCCCKFGPMSLALHPSCINCGHYGCSYCVAEAMESISLPTASEPEPTAILMGAPSTTDDAIIQPSSTASLTTFCRDNPSQTNTIHETFSNQALTDGETYWYCCGCGDGPKTTANNPACSMDQFIWLQVNSQILHASLTPCLTVRKLSQSEFLEDNYRA
ncbi:uncharacterized protein K441DRAFT_696440 [Cenococcum geophilum 1.58]|uniref:uncharacterized protein n=1 Tax=Cenococcum geophilum 1.58 TaxID=794803 RepID=UPI00358F0CCA|nr:hypothetical protein K441DRAFT_696440 [Cenococcum geophilum 1.58]